MCRRVVCSECGKPGYAGCGKHIEQVLGDVSPEDRCRCREELAARKAADAGEATPWLDKVRKIFN
jgi:hypothetical protein